MTATSLTLLINSSPAPTSVLDAMQELTIESSVDAASTFRLRLGLAPGTGGDWPLLDPSLFAPGAKVQCGIAVGSPAPTFIHVGYVASQSVSYGDGQSVPSVEIGGLDVTALMNLEDKMVAWANMPDSTIATQILASYSLVPTVTMTAPVLSDPEGTTIQRGSDIRFLRHLAYRNGFAVYTLPNPQTGLEVGYFQAVNVSESPLTTLVVHAGDSTSVSGLRITNDMLRPTTVIADELDKSHSSQSAQVQTSSNTVGQTSTVSLLPRTATTRLTGTGLRSSTNLQRAAQAVVDRASYALVARGQVPSSLGPMTPGTVIGIAGAGAAHSGPWVVRAVKHVITPGSYLQHFTATRNGIGNPGLSLPVGV